MGPALVKYLMKFKDNGRYTVVYGKTLQVYAWIAGKDFKSTLERSFFSLNPACSQDRVAEVSQATPQVIEAALHSARQAGIVWAQQSMTLLPQVLRRLAELLQQQHEVLKALLIRESGWPQRELQRELEALRAHSLSLAQECGLQQHSSQAEVCALLTGSQVPLTAIFRTLCAGLYGGQSFVWKASDKASAAAYLLTRLLSQAGLPDGVLNLLPGPAATGQALLAQSQRFDWLEFFGSHSLGQELQARSELQGLPIRLNLQERSTAVVMNDADLGALVPELLRSCFACAGQVAGSINTVIVHKNISQNFQRRLLAQLQALRVGDPSLNRRLDYGPLRCTDTLQQFLAHWARLQEQGARMLNSESVQSKSSQGRWGAGGMSRDSKLNPFVGDPDLGHYVWPILVELPASASLVAQTSVWGPMLVWVEVSSLQEALAQVNAMSAASVAFYSANAARVQEFQAGLQAPLLTVNHCPALNPVELLCS